MTREEAIRILASSCIPGSKQTEALETLIPELAETEDERIRKSLYEFFDNALGKDLLQRKCGLNPDSVLTWLEKQKEEEGYEAIPVESTLEYKLGFKAGKESEKQKEQSITANDLDEEIKRFFDDCIDVHEAKLYGNISQRVIPVDCYELTARHFAKWGEKQKDKFTDETMAMKDEIDEGFTKFMEKDQKHTLKFKVGDKVHLEGDDVNILTITGIEKDRYLTDNSYGPILFGAEDIWQIVEQKPMEPSDDELERHQKELHNFKVFAAKQAKEHHIFFVHDFEWNNFCGEILSYFNEQKSVDYEAELKKCKDNPLYFYDKYVSIKQKPAECIKATINGEPIPIENQSVDIPLIEWNEEDERMLSRCIKSIEISKQFADSDTFKVAKDKEIDWLENRIKSFRPVKQEWSEEDEKTINDACCFLGEYAGYIGSKNWGKSSMLFSIVDKLKSLRPQYYGDVTMTETYKMGKEAGEASHWKPSEEQMEALKNSAYGSYQNGDGPILRELYEQLKKLGVKEEPEYYQHFDPDC